MCLTGSEFFNSTSASRVAQFNYDADQREKKGYTIFRMIDGRWQQVHHHGSIEDPDLLDKYQKAIKDPHEEDE